MPVLRYHVIFLKNVYEPNASTISEANLPAYEGIAEHAIVVVHNAEQLAIARQKLGESKVIGLIWNPSQPSCVAKSLTGLIWCN